MERGINTVYLDLETYDNMCDLINKKESQIKELQALIGKLKMLCKDEQLREIKERGKLDYFYHASDIDEILGFDWEHDADIIKAFGEISNAGNQE